MQDKHWTMHARKRMQQRAISETAIRLIETFGECRYQKGGSYYAYVPKKVIDELRRAIETLKSVRAIYGEQDKLITAMHSARIVRTTKYVA